MFQRILVPVADGPCSEQAAQHAAQLSRLLGCQMVFMHVLADEDGSPVRARAAAQALLERLSRDARFPPLLLVVPSEGRSVSDCILEVARAENADLIVMGTHGRQGVERLVLGSVAQSVAGSSEIPVQIIPIRPRQANRFGDRWRRALGETS